MTTPTPRTKRRRLLGGWRMTRRSAAIAVAFLLIAAPAGASIIVQNYMEADISATVPCFDKTTGDDPATSTQATFSEDPGTDTVIVDGVDLLEEKITVNGMIGDRVIYTDVVRYVNNCDEAIDVFLTNVTASGDWTNVAAELWLSNVAVPADVDPNIDTIDDDWQDDYVLVPATSTGLLADTTGTVTIAPGAEIRGAFVVSSDVAFAGGPATLNWIAQATINS